MVERRDVILSVYVNLIELGLFYRGVDFVVFVRSMCVVVESLDVIVKRLLVSDKFVFMVYN